MSSLAEILGSEASEIFTAAVERAAERLVDERLYTGTEAVEFFNLPRTALKRIRKTQLEGRSKPKYSAKNIKTYLALRTY